MNDMTLMDLLDTLCNTGSPPAATKSAFLDLGNNRGRFWTQIDVLFFCANCQCYFILQRKQKMKTNQMRCLVFLTIIFIYRPSSVSHSLVVTASIFLSATYIPAELECDHVHDALGSQRASEGCPLLWEVPVDEICPSPFSGGVLAVTSGLPYNTMLLEACLNEKETPKQASDKNGGHTLKTHYWGLPCRFPPVNGGVVGGGGRYC